VTYGHILKANLSGVRKNRNQVMQKTFPMCFYLFLHFKSQTSGSKFEFCQIKLGRTTDKSSINWQKFAQVGLLT